MGRKTLSSESGDVFAFGNRDGLDLRAWDNAAAMWSAPWRAYWALAFEALDPENYTASRR